MLRHLHVGLPTGALVLFVALGMPIAGDAGSRPVAADWTRSAASDTFASLCDHATAYVGEDKVLLYFGVDTWVYDLSDDDWQLHPVTGPSARGNHMMAHLGGDQVLLFGGPNITPDDETWVYDLHLDAWTQRFPPVRPAARFDQAMAYIRNGQALLFGGNPGSAPFSAVLGDTWLFDARSGTWVEKLPSARPAPRFEHAMAPIGTNRVIVFGGTSPYGPDMNDTWVYDLSENTWTLQVPSTIPAPQACHAMASIASGKALMLGDGTWIYSARPNPKAP